MVSIGVATLDETQLRRIEAVHRGFLYQHLYLTACLLKAAAAGVSEVITEADEDVEVVLPDRWLYVQVKTRIKALTEADIESALQRFSALRQQHADGKRPGRAAFIVISNVEPGPKLFKLQGQADWPADILPPTRQL